MRVQGLHEHRDGAAAISGAEDVVTSEDMASRAVAALLAVAAVHIPTAASLLQRARKMFLDVTDGPSAFGGDDPPVEVTKGLILFAAEAVRELSSSHDEAIHLACGKLDDREALAYLVGDAAGLGRIPAEAARKVGDKAGKLVWVKKGTPPLRAQLADAKRSVQRRAGKLPEDASLEKALGDAHSAVLQMAVQLPLPSREECEAAERARVRAGRKCAPPHAEPPAEPSAAPSFEDRWQGWCERHGHQEAWLQEHKRRYQGEAAWERRPSPMMLPPTRPLR